MYFDVSELGRFVGENLISEGGFVVDSMNFIFCFVVLQCLIKSIYKLFGNTDFQNVAKIDPEKCFG